MSSYLAKENPLPMATGTQMAREVPPSLLVKTFSQQIDEGRYKFMSFRGPALVVTETAGQMEEFDRNYPERKSTQRPLFEELPPEIIHRRAPGKLTADKPKAKKGKKRKLSAEGRAAIAAAAKKRWADKRKAEAKAKKR